MTPSATADLADEYSAKARAYADLWAPILLPLALPVLDAIPVGAAGRVLDLGAGTGHLHDPIRERAPACCLVMADRAGGMLRLAQAGARDTRVVVDAHDLAFADAVFDVALLAFVLFHVARPSAALREVRRVLRPGGTVGVVVWGADSATPGTDVCTQELDASGAAPDARDPSIMQHALMDTPGKLRLLLEECGFVDVHVRETRGAHQFAVENLLELHFGVGVAGRRVKSLPDGQAAECRERVAERLRGLSADELVYRPDVVWGRARKRER